MNLHYIAGDPTLEPQTGKSMMTTGWPRRHRRVHG
jgi:hypothetical protein